ncbi:MAG: hypothetical protein M0Z80_13965 [Treponema sp.]|nr:hypothetical protein [Treponema sp.]
MTGKGLSPACDAARTARASPGTERPGPSDGLAAPGEERSRPGAERSARILELKAKLGDEDYMAGAILRIATVLSARLTEGYFDGGRAKR